MTVPGITTTVDGCLLVLLVAPDVSDNVALTWTKPSGWTSIVGTTTAGWSNDAIAYTPQATAGATGDISCTFAGANGGYIVYLIAIAPNPAGVLIPVAWVRA